MTESTLPPMFRTRLAGVTGAAVGLLAAALPLALVGALGAMPPVRLGGSPVGALPAAVAVVLLVVAALAALPALVAGLRHGSVAHLLTATSSAGIVGAAVAIVLEPPLPAVPLLLAAALALAASITDRLELRVGRGPAIVLVVTLLALVELSALAGALPGATGPLLVASAPMLAVAGATAFAAALTSRTERDALVLVAAGAIGLAADRAGSLEALVGLGALVGGQLLALRRRLERPEEERPASPVLLPELAAAMPDAVVAFDGQLRLRDWNAAAARLLGLDAGAGGTRLEDLLGVPIGDLPAAGATPVTHRAVGGLEVTLQRSGEGVTAVVREPIIAPGADELGRELRTTIEELLRARRTIDLQRGELERLARVDPLTGVDSRSALLERLGTEVAQARRYQHPLAILLVDVDRFRELNAEHGIDAGDQVLREVALRVRLRVREADALGRAGSDGFLAVLPHTDEGGAATFAEALRHRLSLRPVAIGELLVPVTVSVGIATMKAGEELDVDGLLSRVEEALASARGAGGDRIALDRNHGLARLEDRRRRDAASGHETAQDRGS